MDQLVQDRICAKLEQVHHVTSLLSPRSLTPQEKDVFDANGNSGTLLVYFEKDSLVLEALKRIRQSDFRGSVATVLFQTNDHLPEKACSQFEVAHSSIYSSFLELGCQVYRNTRIETCFISYGSRVEGCGCIKGAPSGTCFGNDLVLSPSLESGQLATRVCVATSLEGVSKAVMADGEFRLEHDKLLAEFSTRMTSTFTIIGACSTVENCPELLESYLDEHVHLRSGCRVVRSSIMESCIVEQSSDVMRSLLQQKCHVASQAIVKDSLMCQGSGVDIQGKLLGSVLGPGSHIAEGEVTASLVGPMVGFHHQSMLIASFWPAGRGNVGYGANCGSNHTSRTSDQSMWVGEGVFFGLGASIKFPMNLLQAAYTVIATGAVFGPGRVSFPFSLVTSSTNTPLPCRVAPGWGLHSNAYAVERNCLKMKERIASGYSKTLFRSSIARMVLVAMEVIEQVLKQFPERTTFQDDPNNQLFLGGGFALRSDLEKGAAAYKTFLELFSLRTVLNAGEHESDPVEVVDEIVSTGLHSPSDDSRLAKTLVTRLFAGYSQSQLQRELVIREAAFAKQVYDSKLRDHKRASQVFPGNRLNNAISITQDKVVASAQARAKATETRNL